MSIEPGNIVFLEESLGKLQRAIYNLKMELNTEHQALSPDTLVDLQNACNEVFVTLNMERKNTDIVADVRAVIASYDQNDVYEDDLVDHYIPALIAEIERLRGNASEPRTTASERHPGA